MIAANINMYSFDIINPSMSDWKLIESAFDSTCFQTRQWCDFLRKIGKRLFILSVKGESETIGYFVGVRAWIGISAVLAPTWATGTYTQGLTMLKETPEEQRVCIYLEMYAWLRAKRIASYFKVDDWHLRRDYPKMGASKRFPSGNVRQIQYQIFMSAYLACRCVRAPR